MMFIIITFTYFILCLRSKILFPVYWHILLVAAEIEIGKKIQILGNELLPLLLINEQNSKFSIFSD